MKNVLPDLLFIMGSASMSYGAWRVYEPAGFIMLGLAFILFGIVVAKA